MKQFKEDTIHCAIVRIDNRNEKITKTSIAEEIKKMIAEFEFGVIQDMHEELSGMDESEIKVERKSFNNYFNLFS